MPPPSASDNTLPSGGPFASIFVPLGEVLDATNATREALVKASRDVTIAAKRLIFALHRLDVASLPTPPAHPVLLKESHATDGTSPSVSPPPPPSPLPPPPPHAGLDAATETARALSRQVVTTIGSRLVSPSDAFIYARAFSPGLQEYVEAVVFLAWLRTARLASRDDVQKGLDAAIEEVKAEAAMAATTTATATAAVPPSEAGVRVASRAGGRRLSSPPTPPLTARRVVLSWDDYLLGVADVAGEVMRLAVAAGSGSSGASIAVSHRAAALLQALTVAYEGLPHGTSGMVGREGGQKLSAMRASRAKVERALYTRVVRAAEFGEEVHGGVAGVEGGDCTGAGGGSGGEGGGKGGSGGGGEEVAGCAKGFVDGGGKGRTGGNPGEGGRGGMKRPATTGISAAGGATAGGEEPGGSDAAGGTMASCGTGVSGGVGECRDDTTSLKKVRIS
ncbi:hypothetical protein MMPV_004687 [Pyropia vietnamensis]